MSSSSKPSHAERTSIEPRGSTLHKVFVSSIQQVNDSIRTYVLSAKQPIKFLPGQWLDVHVPSLSKPGGFTITSPPALATGIDARVTLAVQKSTEPVATWLWRDRDVVLGSELSIRVGGSFTWPLATVDVKRVLFIAGGVVINPLISMLKHMDGTGTMPEIVDFIYSTKAPDMFLKTEQILFLDDLLQIAGRWKANVVLHLFISGRVDGHEDGFPSFEPRRLTHEDVKRNLATNIDHTVGYICGTPPMTDEYSALLESIGLAKEQIRYEKWW